MSVLELLRYQAADGHVPFTQWLGSIRDKQAQAKVRVRLRRLEAGLFGDCEPVGEGVLEMREHVGAGYRVYFGRHGRFIVILLCGGTKKTQSSDVKAAKEFWADWKRRQA
jgi:putative addiction module killer protein